LIRWPILRTCRTHWQLDQQTIPIIEINTPLHAIGMQVLVFFHRLETSFSRHHRGVSTGQFHNYPPALIVKG
jgi:hypothetical protein